MKSLLITTVLLFASLMIHGQIANDDCGTAAALSLDANNEASGGFDTTMATASGVSPSCQTNPVDGWYSFVMPFNGNALITGSGNTEYAIYDACGGTELGCIRPGNHVFGLQNGQTYFLQAWRINSTTGSFTFTISLTEAIPNDECADAIALTLDGNNEATATLQTNGASISAPDPSCETNARDGWYSFVMPFNGNALITGSGNTEYAVYDACGGTELGCIRTGSHLFDLQNGQTYFLRAWRINGVDGAMDFTLTVAEEIPNDECADAIALTLDGNNEATVTLQTNGASVSAPDPSCETNARDGWYSFEMPFNGNALITGSGNTEYAIYDACGGTELGCIRSGSHLFDLQNGQTYFLRAWRINGVDGAMDFTLTVTEAIPNDECADAIALALDANNEATATLQTNGASISAPDPSCETNARDGWYSFEMPFNGNALITGSGNTEYAIYDACGGTELGCVRPGNHVFGLQNGQTYFLRAWRINGVDGSMNFTLTVTEEIPNDECITATVMTFDVNDVSMNSFDSNGASISANDPSCEANPRDGWYEFTSPINGSYIISGSSNGEYAVYDACGGTELHCGINNSSFPVVDGETYFVRAWYRNGVDGILNVNLTPAPTPVSDGTQGVCEPIPAITIDASNNDEWVLFSDSAGDVVAAIDANGNNLGLVEMDLFIDNTDTRDNNGDPYLRRELGITVQNQPASNVQVRMYILGDEYDDLEAIDPDVNVINNLVVLKEDVANCTSGYGNTGIELNPLAQVYSQTDYSLMFQVSSFSVFFPAGPLPTLPVELADFQGEKDGKFNQLYWATASEDNVSHFEIERSGDGRVWEELGDVTAIGFSQTLQSYSFSDSNPFGNTFYRLRMVDLDDTYEYSDVIRVVNADVTTHVTVYPNPVSELFIIEHQDILNVQDMQLIGVKGDIVKDIEVDRSNTNSVDVSNLPSGVYFLKIVTGDGVETVKVIKQ